MTGHTAGLIAWDRGRWEDAVEIEVKVKSNSAACDWLNKLHVM